MQSKTSEAPVNLGFCHLSLKFLDILFESCSLLSFESLGHGSRVTRRALLREYIPIDGKTSTPVTLRRIGREIPVTECEKIMHLLIIYLVTLCPVNGEFQYFIFKVGTKIFTLLI